MSPALTGKTVGRDDLWEIASRQFEDLKFADQKAIALLGIADLVAAVIAAVMGYFSGNTKTASEPLWIQAVLLAIICVGVVCAALATYSAMNAIRPRGQVGAKKLFAQTLEKLRQQNDIHAPLTHLVTIASFQKWTDYFTALRALDEDEIDRQLASDIHRMATVAFEKYRWISRAVRWAKIELLTFLFGIIALMVTRFFQR